MRRDSESAFLTEALNRIGACISSQKAGSGDYRPVAEGDVLQTVLINRLEDRGQTRDRLMVGVFEQSGRNGRAHGRSGMAAQSGKGLGRHGECGITCNVAANRRQGKGWRR